MNDFAAATQGSIPVPDLREAGLSFKRIQRLGYENRPLLQMIFLPAEGMPTALCVVPAQLEDTTIAQSALNGMQVVSWHRRGMSYVLVTALPENTAHSVAVKLLEGKFPALYQS